MSGIVGIVNLDGAPVDRALLERLTESLAFRGPDAQDVWVSGAVGFGHTLLRTTYESANERQPCSLDGQVRAVLDGRIDGRADLVRALSVSGVKPRDGIPDVELLLHAYDAWGEECVKHLIGDFAFAIWDGRRQRLFCARDQIGIKQFYYAHIGSLFVFSNTLNCVRAHPAVSNTLNELAIGDFLCFDFNQDPATTTFADIQRLPPAHTLTVANGELRISRYWTLPIDGRIRYRRQRDYVEHFNALLREAVNDRLRTDHVGVMMSGGLDSSTVAVAAHEALSARGADFDLRAYTAVYDRRLPDEERRYSSLVAARLGIPIEHIAIDDYELYEPGEHTIPCTPEPFHEHLHAISLDLFRSAARHGRVLLTGEGGDVGFLAPRLPDLAKVPGLPYTATAAARYAFQRRKLPRIGVRTALRQLFRGPAPIAEQKNPSWLDEAFAERLARMALTKRSAERQERGAQRLHHLRPETHELLMSPYWPFVFAPSDAEVHRLPLELRHPLFDLRLIEFLFAIPPVPWYLDKELLRVATAGRLPEAVRLRPKAPVNGDPLRIRMQHFRALQGETVTAGPQLRRFIQPVPIPIDSTVSSGDLWLNLRVYTLNNWVTCMASGFSQDEERNIL